MNSYLPFTASTAIVDGVDLVSRLFVLRGAEGRVRVSEAAVEDVIGVSIALGKFNQEPRTKPN